MKLQTLRLHGFKSFADRTQIDFREGVTAIVGSNGCGKSNIADAIRWVLGEQRPSAIRGSKMEEIIFQGTTRRRALSYAEVSLLFDNQSGRVPIPQTEIEVARKVFREGGSEYYLNRTACRLRDVHGLLRDTGLGANAYAIIEATMIETLLSDRADERRALFEEAAGVGKYKDSRQAASRRLEAAEADLTRLDDLIAEVESKVRSLARQKRKAERYREMRARRLDLEVAIAKEELAALEEALRAAEARREELAEMERSAATERSAAEAVLETRRLEATEVGRERMERAAKLEAIRTRLDERQREVLVAGERRAHAEQRIAQLAQERTSMEERIRRLEEILVEARDQVGRASEAVTAARELVDSRSGENQKTRQALLEERATTEAAVEQARSLSREIATCEGDRAAAERRGREARERRAQLATELERLHRDVAQMSDQTELWETRAEEIRERLESANEAFSAATAEVESLRARVQRSRDEVRVAEDRLSTLSAQVDAREALERNYEGFAPAVAAIMSERSRFPGVHGPLADVLREAGGDDRTQAVETFLGPLLQALVIDDLATARAIRRWFQEEWKDGGSIYLLPLEALEPAAATSPDRWVEVLLAGLEVVGEDPLAALAVGSVRVGPGGEVVDARGVIRLAASREGQGILSRRKALARLKKELADAIKQRDARFEERDRLRAALAEAEERSREAEELRRTAESQLRGLELDAAAHHDRRGRLLQESERIERMIESLDQEARKADEDLAAHERRLDELARSVQTATSLEAEARARLAELEKLWDAARDEEAELRVTLARAESDRREAERRLSAAEADREAATSRIAQIDREAVQIRESLESLSNVREVADREIEELFAKRDEESGALALLDARLAEVDSELAELGERSRTARRREAEAAEQRHQLELEIADARSRTERVRERLEVEWGRPWSALVSEATPPAEGGLEDWRRELRESAEQIDNLGPVNMLAVEEHAEESARLEFLQEQRKDLVASRDNLTTAIREINRTACEVFLSTFEAVRANFRRTFHSLFEGGECDIWLADPDDPLESAVEIQASPRGKKTQRIHLLSGGERTLTALALLFALYLVKPSPFCVLDEVDAPLDETNILRFIQLLNDFKQETQFIVITHHPRTMEAADWVYGVTMEEPGVSSIVGVELLGVWESERAAAAG